MAREDIERMFTATRELGERFIAAMSKYPEDSDAETWVYQASMHFFFCKAYKTYQAIGLLCSAGFVEDAESLSRTLFEILLQACWMKSDPKRRARSFAEHSPVRQYNLYLRMRKLKSPQMSAVVSRIESKTAQLAEMKRQYDEFKMQFLKPGRKSVKSPDDLSENWWGNSIRWLGEKLGMEDHYATVYWSQSDLVHTGSTSIRDYLKRNQDGWQANCYPTPENADCELTALWASGWVIGIVEVLNDAWSLRLDSEIARALQEFDRFGQKVLGTTPKRD
jgi:hypothetical protein